MARPASRPRRAGRAATTAAVVLAVALGGTLGACGAADDDQPGSAAPGARPSPGNSTSGDAGPSGSSAGPDAGPSDGPTTRIPTEPDPLATAPPPGSERPVMGGGPPPWLGTRELPVQPNGFGEVRRTPFELVQRRFTLPDRLPSLPGNGFASRVVTPAPESVVARSSWRPRCPVAADDLSWVRLTFWGFDEARHTGELLVHRSVAKDVVRVFRTLYRERFPIEEMRITRRAELTAPPTGDGNNTGAFVCRSVAGGSAYSQHAYGLAVDVNPFQNPYRNGRLVLPELASSYLERTWERPGMVTADGPVVEAFADIGWTWGGTWRTRKDYHHFSANGR